VAFGLCRLPVLCAVRALFVQALQALPRKVVCVFTPCLALSVCANCQCFALCVRCLCRPYRPCRARLFASLRRALLCRLVPIASASRCACVVEQALQALPRKVVCVFAPCLALSVCADCQCFALCVRCLCRPYRPCRARLFASLRRALLCRFVPIASALRCACVVCAGLTVPAAQGCLRLYAVPCFAIALELACCNCAIVLLCEHRVVWKHNGLYFKPASCAGV
jgi:hypothetical protein